MLPPRWLCRGLPAAIALAAVALVTRATLTAEVGPAPVTPTELSEPIVPVLPGRAAEPKRVARGGGAVGAVMDQ
jgi:hypothetical protein